MLDQVKVLAGMGFERDSCSGELPKQVIDITDERSVGTKLGSGRKVVKQEM